MNEADGESSSAFGHKNNANKVFSVAVGSQNISDAENIGKFGSRVEIGKFRKIKFEKIGSLLVITLNGEKSESIRVVRI